MKKYDSNGKYSRIWKTAGIAFLALAIVCGAVFWADVYRQKQAEDAYEHLAAQNPVSIEEISPVTVDTPSSAGSENEISGEEIPVQTDPLKELEKMGVPIPEKEIDFDGLRENTNEDIYAWIYIPDSEIDYPVLQHPTDNSYYLNYNLDGSRGYPGCIYSENYNAKDFSDPNTILYGHNMKNGTMFAGLHRFGDIEYFESHPYVYIYMPEKLYVYEIFASYVHSDEHLLYSYDFSDSAVFEDYIAEIMSIRDMNCNRKDGVKITAGDRILTLSTCISNRPNNRYIVQGVLLNEN